MSDLTSFVLMPFDKEFDDIYEQFVCSALENAGYSTVRADDIRSQRNILNDIVELIVKSNIIVADVTAINPNVFYELGISHALGKNVILLTQNVEDLPFDLQQYRVIVYDTHFTEMEEAKEDLEKYAREVREGSVTFGSPVSDFAKTRGVRIRDLHEKAVSSSMSRELETVDADKGFLDYVADFENATNFMNDIVMGVNEKMENMKDKTRNVNMRINKMQESSEPGSASQLRQHVRELAREVNNFADYVSERNDRYSDVIPDVRENLERILSINELTNNNDKEVREELRKFYRMSKKLEQKASGARDSIRNLSDVMLEQKGIESHLNLALDRGARALDTYQSHIDQTISIFQKARLYAEDRLD